MTLEDKLHLGSMIAKINLSRIETKRELKKIGVQTKAEIDRINRKGASCEKRIHEIASQMMGCTDQDQIDNYCKQMLAVIDEY